MQSLEIDAHGGGLGVRRSMFLLHSVHEGLDFPSLLLVLMVHPSWKVPGRAPALPFSVTIYLKVSKEHFSFASIIKECFLPTHSASTSQEVSKDCLQVEAMNKG